MKKIECHNFEKEIIKDFDRFFKKSTLDENGCKQRTKRVFSIAGLRYPTCRTWHLWFRHPFLAFLGLFDAEKKGDSTAILAPKSVQVFIVKSIKNYISLQRYNCIIRKNCCRFFELCPIECNLQKKVRMCRFFMLSATKLYWPKSKNCVGPGTLTVAPTFLLPRWAVDKEDTSIV